ncbi:hypothetical protein T11_3673 [Trichinella zimbabwensis]|uniref:Uncharacterized protein n=1 Tax=Trichinella zimbabwensis TaxID=268475 RepID=A0A0V1GYC3_9BILA|nr:hypothetical protein T11_3673 [Trichinella zimbabwensis]
MKLLNLDAMKYCHLQRAKGPFLHNWCIGCAFSKSSDFNLSCCLLFNGATFLFHFNGPNQSVSQSVSLVGCSVGGKESKNVYCLKKLLSSAQQLLSLQQLINFGLSIV